MVSNRVEEVVVPDLETDLVCKKVGEVYRGGACERWLVLKWIGLSFSQVWKKEARGRRSSGPSQDQSALGREVGVNGPAEPPEEKDITRRARYVLPSSRKLERNKKGGKKRLSNRGD